MIKELWTWVIKEAKELKEFFVEFGGRLIKINYKKPKFIGDGKAYLLMLRLFAFSYLYIIAENHLSVHPFSFCSNPGLYHLQSDRILQSQGFFMQYELENSFF